MALQLSLQPEPMALPDIHRSRQARDLTQNVGSTGGQQGLDLELYGKICVILSGGDPLVAPLVFPVQPQTQMTPAPVALEKAIAESKSLLALPDNWDEEGAKPIKAATWQRAARFLREQETEARKRALTLPTPRISAGPDGSIDLHWRLEGFELLANVPEDPAAAIMYYGDDRGEQTAKGSLPPGKTHSVPFALWLVQTR